MIAATPSVDPHAHLRCDEPGAPDLANLPSAHWVQTELRAVHRMRNTAIDWCRFRIFRDLYDINEPHLTESNPRELFDKVARSGQDPAWAPPAPRPPQYPDRRDKPGQPERRSIEGPRALLTMLDPHYPSCPASPPT
ncbi:MAG: hypothetical protein ACM35G_06850 [Planctomycetaceae bacterium]